MKRSTTALTLIAALLATGGMVWQSQPANAAEAGAELMTKSWQHDGFFGTFDRSAAQRGLQVYREVCSSCHGLKYVAFRNLAALGYTEDQIKAIAAESTITDGPNDEGAMFDREGRPSDRFPSPFANEKEAAFINGGVAPPDLSVMTKAREGGANYVYSLLRGYEEPPPDIEVREGSYYNLYFPGHWISMPPPLYEDGVTYADGTPATIEQMASDVAVFLSWAAEPKLEERKQTGLKVMLFLITLTGLFYATKRKVWTDAH
jgi:ubiquinol-cytochrome c reductase cytochrome c1 subunit